jgi:competence protein ComEA
MSRFFKDYLSFSRSEKNALIILSFILILIILANFFLPYLIINEKKFTPQQLAEIKNIQAILNDTCRKSENTSGREMKYKSNYVDSLQAENNMGEYQLFVFDPNTITPAKWIKLGVPEKVINHIVNYIQKGGRFYKKEDLRKIYGLNEKVYERLEPYININSENRKPYTSQIFNTNKLPIKEKLKITIELNTATEADLDKLPTIGESFAKRIVKYRQMLGGYYSPGQLMEVYGFDTARYNTIKGMITIDVTKINKIPINLADVKQLGKHPYIGFKNAELIIDQRNSKGPFKSINELEKTLGNASYNRLSAYLKLWD